MVVALNLSANFLRVYRHSIGRKPNSGVHGPRAISSIRKLIFWSLWRVSRDTASLKFHKCLLCRANAQFSDVSKDGKERLTLAKL